MWNMALRKTTRNRFGKAGAHPQLAWESQLPLKPYLSLQPSDFEGNCDSFDCFLDFCFISWYSFDLLRKCGLLALNLASIFEKLLHRKTFYLPAAFIFEQFVFIKAIVSHETLHKNCTCSNETGAMNLFFEKPTAYGSAESLRYLPSCCSPVVALPELVMNLS